MIRTRPSRGSIHADQRGMTLAELLIAMSVTMIVAVAITSITISVQGNVQRQTAASRNNDEARLAIMQLDREIRSGNILYDPGAEEDPHYGLRVYTQANASTRTPGFQCVQWVIRDRQLLRRWWPSGNPGSASSWAVIADGIVNDEMSVPAFALDTEPNRGARTLVVTLLVNNKLETYEGQTTRIQTSLTGRNTTYEFSTGACTPAPAG